MFVAYEVRNSEFETGSLFHACHLSLLVIIMIIIIGIVIGCCATNRKVAGSIPAGVTGIFH
jgi:hypothetical protein